MFRLHAASLPLEDRARISRHMGYLESFSWGETSVADPHPIKLRSDSWGPILREIGPNL